MIDLNKFRKFLRPGYREGFLRSHVRASIAYQVQALRTKLHMTQAQFAELTGKTQTVISRLEDTTSGMVGVQTLLDIANGTGVALLVQFVSYPDFLARTEDMSDAALQPDTIEESVKKLEARATVTILDRPQPPEPRAFTDAPAVNLVKNDLAYAN